jgi:RNA polymerase sigma factor (sigma-70 family)
MAHARDAEDIQLLEAGKHGDLLTAYYPVVLERLRLRLPEPDAYEVAQRVFERLLRELTRGRTYAVPFRVVVHKVVEWKLKEFWQGRRDVSLPEDWDNEGPDPFREVEEEQDLRALFGDLPERARQVAELRWLEGLEIDEIARRLELDRNAVDQALHRARAALRKELGG